MCGNCSKGILEIFSLTGGLGSQHFKKPPKIFVCLFVCFCAFPVVEDGFDSVLWNWFSWFWNTEFFLRVGSLVFSVCGLRWITGFNIAFSSWVIHWLRLATVILNWLGLQQHSFSNCFSLAWYWLGLSGFASVVLGLPHCPTCWWDPLFLHWFFGIVGSVCFEMPLARRCFACSCTFGYSLEKAWDSTHSNRK